MANNQYINKVQFGNSTIMDITDTSATANDVLVGEVFYTQSGQRSVGILDDATQSAHGLMSATDKTKLDNLPTDIQNDATGIYHLGLYIDEDGDICQAD